MGQGTGTFISSDGYLVTAGHVVTGDGNYSVVTYDGRQLSASIVARNVSYAPDVAILKVNGNGFPFVPIGSTPSKGDIAIYVGHPFTLLWAGFGGVITDIDSSQAFEQILYNPSDSGASGSTILNLNGDLIGVLSGERGFPLPHHPLLAPNNNHCGVQSISMPCSTKRVSALLQMWLPTSLTNMFRGWYKPTEQTAATHHCRSGFTPPNISSSLCRICLHWGGLMDWIKDVLANISPLEEVRYLQMMAAAMQEPEDISIEERAQVKSVGRSLQDAVVQLEIRTSGDPLGGSSSGGTGFFVSPDGYLITNAHVVEGAQTIEAITFDGRRLQGKIVGSVPADQSHDLALVKVSTAGERWVPLADDGYMDQLVVGVGHPQNLEWAIYGGRVSFWDPPPEWLDAPSHFQFDAVNVGRFERKPCRQHERPIGRRGRRWHRRQEVLRPNGNTV